MGRYWNSLTKAVFKKHRLDDAISPLAFIGKSVVAHKGAIDGPEERLEIKSILGSKAKELARYLEINGSHLVHSLSFFTQLMEGRVPTQDELNEFDLATDVVKIKEIKDGQTQGQQKQTSGSTDRPTAA